MASVKDVSMQNTLFDGHKLIINRLSYRNRNPKIGDIIIFYENREIGSFTQEFVRSLKNIIPFVNSKEEARDRYVKRVIGIPGDVIDIINGDVYLNGEYLEETYVKGVTEEKALELPVTVGKNQLFVMGDNRENSMDSRAFGLIEMSHVEGKATFRIYPFNQFGKLN